MNDLLPEKEYRNLVQKTFQKLETAFENIDPDRAEFELSQGSVVLLFANGTRCILSTQPSVRQVWLAAAAKGLGLHFNYDAEKNAWFDDKGRGIELLKCVKEVVADATGITLNL